MKSEKIIYIVIALIAIILFFQIDSIDIIQKIKFVITQNLLLVLIGVIIALMFLKKDGKI